MGMCVYEREKRGDNGHPIAFRQLHAKKERSR